MFVYHVLGIILIEGFRLFSRDLGVRCSSFRIGGVGEPGFVATADHAERSGGAEVHVAPGGEVVQSISGDPAYARCILLPCYLLDEPAPHPGDRSLDSRGRDLGRGPEMSLASVNSSISGVEFRAQIIASSIIEGPEDRCDIPLRGGIGTPPLDTVAMSTTGAAGSPRVCTAVVA